MCSPPFDAPGERLKTYGPGFGPFLQIYKGKNENLTLVHYLTSENLNVMDFQISVEAHGNETDRNISTRTDKRNRQRASYTLWRFVSLPDYQQDNTF